MGKGLVGNSLSYAMVRILEGEVSFDDIDKIYAGTCLTEETMADLINHYGFFWRNVARERAKTEICKKHGVERLSQIEDFDVRLEEVSVKEEELLPEVTAEANELLHNLWNSNKVIQTRYIIPDGQKVKAKQLSKGQVVGEAEFEGREDSYRTPELVYINGEYYYTGYDESAAILARGESGLYNSELELLASQINHTSRGTTERDLDSRGNRSFLFQKLFPQYKDAIANVMGELNDNLKEEDIYSMLKETIAQGGHTAEEIGEAVNDVSHDNINDALSEITGDNTKER